MPIYEARCNKCKRETEYTAHIESMYQTPICCNKPMEKVILTSVLGVVDNPAFQKKYSHMY